MAALNSVNDVLAVLDDRLAAASPDLLRLPASTRYEPGQVVLVYSYS